MKYNEIFKLKKMLEDANIPFKFEEHEMTDVVKSDNGGYDIVREKGYQIIVYLTDEENINKAVDAVEHKYSYGNKNDLLEIMGGLTKEEGGSNDMTHQSVLGYLTAEEVFKRFKYCYENKTMVYIEEQ
jgi:hypothetical protein